MNSSDTAQPDKGDQDDYLIDSIHFSMASRNDLLKIQKILSVNGLPEKDVGEHNDLFMLAWDNGTLVATFGAELLENDGLLRSLSVHLNYRNRGIASELCNRIEAYARNAGVKRLYLLTTTAKNYFVDRGYSVCSRESVPQTVQGTAEFSFLCPCTAVCMVRALCDGAKS